ncbi:DUF1801 domain-containing protein [Candidatus Micrarchaeota archaeon]|nr:DUF1801 domain-containing protein [Candidatus Micrarchaeota archaeon]
MDNDVEKYIEKQKSPQKEILQKVRKIFFKTIPKCEEKTGWGVIVFNKGKFYLAALKNKVHVGFAINGLSKKDISLFEGAGKTMRHIKINSLKEIDEKKIVKLIRLVDKKASKPC